MDSIEDWSWASAVPGSRNTLDVSPWFAGPTRHSCDLAGLVLSVLVTLATGASAAPAEIARANARASNQSTVPNQPPTVQLVFPPNFVTVFWNSTLRLRARAADLDGTIQKVEFFDNDILIGQVDREPYELTWFPNDSRPVLTVRATDDRGATSTSTPLLIIMLNHSSSPGYQIIAPTNQAVFKAPASVAVVARLTSTDGTEDPIEVFLGTNRVGTITGGPPYSLLLTNLLEGEYDLTLQNNGNSGTNHSGPVHFTVGAFDNNPPSVAITNFPGLNRFGMPATIQIKATAADVDGQVTRVDFLASHTLIGTVTNAPFTFIWSNVMINPQIYEITAAATDDKGTRSESHEIDVELFNEPGPTPFIIIMPPPNGSVALLGTPVVIASQVVSTDNNIRPVEIFDGTNLLGSIPDPSYSLTVSNLTLGDHSLSARTTDLSGAIIGGSPSSLTIIDLRLTETAPAPDGQFQFNIQGVPPGHYGWVQTSSDLRTWQRFYGQVQFIQTNFFRFSDPNATNYPQRFYRFTIPF